MTLLRKILDGGGFRELPNPTVTLKKTTTNNQIWQTGLIFLNHQCKLHFNYVYYYTKEKKPKKF